MMREIEDTIVFPRDAEDATDGPAAALSLAPSTDELDEGGAAEEGEEGAAKEGAAEQGGDALPLEPFASRTRARLALAEVLNPPPPVLSGRAASLPPVLIGHGSSLLP